MEFEVDQRSGLPTYLQLVQQVRHALRLGLLEAGDQLPTAREVVAKLAINPNTVHKAYRELERDGLVTVRPGQGTFIARSLTGPGFAQLGKLRESLFGWLDEAKAAGLDAEEIEALFRSAVRQAAAEEGVA
ncbi:MAG: GntR family transcriptional regulator [Streptosporangiaceae bacterium]